MAGISIDFAANVGKFIAGAGNVETALEKVSDSLDDVARDAQRAGKDAGADLASGVDKGTDKAEASVDNLEKSFRELREDARSNSGKIGDDLGENIKKGADDASEGTKALKENARANLKEVGASFTDIDSAVGGLQGFIAEATEGFGAAGVAAGALAAISLGALQSQLQGAADKINEAKEQAMDLASEIIDADGNLDRVDFAGKVREWALTIADARSWWEVWQKDAVTNLEKVSAAASLVGANVGDIVAAMSDSDIGTARRLLDQYQWSLNQVNAQLDEQMATTSRLGPAQARARQGLLDQADALKHLIDPLKTEITQRDTATRVAQEYATASGTTVEALEAEQAAAEQAADAHAAYGDALTAIADPVSTYTDALADKQQADDDAALSVDDLIKKWNEQADAARTFEANLAVIAANGGQALADELRAQGPEAAGATAELLASADPTKMREAIAAQGRAAGTTIATGVATGLTSQQTAVQTALNDMIRNTTPGQGIRVPVSIYTTKADLDQQVRTLFGNLTIPATIAARPGVAGKG